MTRNAPLCMMPRDRDSEGWAVAKFWLVRSGRPGVAVSFPELVEAVGPLVPATADAVRLLSPGQTLTMTDVDWRVTRLGGRS